MNRVFVALLGALMFFGVACSKDQVSTDASIVGVWEQTEQDGNSTANDPGRLIVSIDANGDYSISSPNAGNNQAYTYKKEGEKLFIDLQNGITQEYAIMTLSEGTLKLKFTSGVGQEYTFKRISLQEATNLGATF